MNDISRLAESQRAPETPEGFASDLFRLLDANGVSFCSWKSNPHAGRALKGLTDIDMLVERSHADRLERLFIEQGFKQLRSLRGAGYPGIQDWLGFDPDSAKLIHIHLHYQILSGLPGIKEFRIPWERLILETRVRHATYGHLWVTDPNLEAVMLLVRSALKYNWLEALLARVSGRKYLQNIFEELELLRESIKTQDVERYAAQILDGATRQSLLRMLSSDHADEDRLARAFRADARAMFRQHRRFGAGAMFRYRVKFVLDRIGSALGRRIGLQGPKKQIGRGGAIISVIGADGSGKSTISRDIFEFLSWKLQVRHVYLGEDTESFALKNLLRLRRLVARMSAPLLGKPKRTAGGFRPSTTLENAELNSKQRLVRYLAETSFAIERMAVLWDRRRKLRQVLRARTNGAIVVTDRFPQTTVAGYLDGPRYLEREAVRGVLPRLAARMERRLYDRLPSIMVDTVLRLHVTADLALRRKPDHSEEAIRKKVSAAPTIRFPGAHHIDIDSTRPLEVVLREARLRAWEGL